MKLTRRTFHEVSEGSRDSKSISKKFQGSFRDSCCFQAISKALRDFREFQRCEDEFQGVKMVSGGLKDAAGKFQEISVEFMKLSGSFREVPVSFWGVRGF